MCRLTNRKIIKTEKTNISLRKFSVHFLDSFLLGFVERMTEEEHKISKEEARYKKIVHLVERGHNKYKTQLAWYKLSGRGGVVDKKGAVVLLQQQVDEGDAEAMWLLGLCYEFEIECEQNMEKAESLYHQSSEKGSVVGMFLAKNIWGTGVLKVESLYMNNAYCVSLI